MSAATQLIAIANTLSWPGAFALVGCAIAAAGGFVGALWAVNR